MTARDVPSAPTGVTASITGSGTVSLSWNAPEFKGGKPITSYLVTMYYETASAAVAWTQTSLTSTVGGSPAATSTILTGLNHLTGLGANPTLAFTVSATNANGTGRPSALPTPPYAGPTTVPTGVLATGAVGSVTVTWAPADGASDPGQLHDHPVCRCGCAGADDRARHGHFGHHQQSDERDDVHLHGHGQQ